MPVISISGIDVNFPFDPYPCQEDYMRKVIETLNGRHNALLESPTGTGKTLCLLCATLSWQQRIQRSMPKIQIGYNLPSEKVFGKPQVNTTASFTSSTIVYASRTHSQLTQVIGELRTCGYQPRMIVLGSRDQLCINDKVSRLRKDVLNQACNSLNARRGCHFKNSLEKHAAFVEGVGGAPSPIMDIEELKNLGINDRICPYFYTRQSSRKADLLLVPYNYIIDATIRKTLDIEWKDCVVILDEGHNIEKNACDGASFQLTTTDIAQCIKEMKQVLQKVHQLESEKSSASSQHKAGHGGMGMGGAQGQGAESNGPSVGSATQILHSLFEFEKRLDMVPLTPISNGVKAGTGEVCCAQPGAWLVDMLEASGFHVSRGSELISDIRKSADFLLQQLDDSGNETAGGGGTGRGPAVPEPKLFTLSRALSRVYRNFKDKEQCVRGCSDSKVFIQSKPNSFTANSYGGSSLSGKPKRTINFWCFSPGVVMEEICALGVRSVIITSGTLSPMSAFKEDLKIPFRVTLENPHVISDKQIFVGGLSHGVGGKLLNSSYENRDTDLYKDELGNTILEICVRMRERNCPELRGGVLVFFPSYGMMEQAAKRWHLSGVWNRLVSAIGAVVMEEKGGGGGGGGQPRSAVGSSPSTNGSGGKYGTKATNAYQEVEYNEHALEDDAPTQGNRNVDTTIVRFEQALSGNRSCMLLAVCRGNMSEGIDFKDNRGRVAIITGIPFAPYLDPWVVLKKKHLDEKILLPSALSSTVASGESSTAVTSRLTGQAWYTQSANRAVNQALGRVIRHQKDWGAIFLLDNRFLDQRQITQLSGWVKNRVRTYPVASNALRDFRAFATAALMDPELAIAVKDNFPKPQSRLPPNEQEMAQNNPTTKSTSFKEVVVSSSALNETRSAGGGGGGAGGAVSFIPPDMLMSQQEQKFNNRERTGFSMQVSQGSSMSQYQTSVQGSEGDLDTLLNKMRSGSNKGADVSVTKKGIRDGSIADFFKQKSNPVHSTSASIASVHAPMVMVVNCEEDDSGGNLCISQKTGMSQHDAMINAGVKILANTLKKKPFVAPTVSALRKDDTSGPSKFGLGAASNGLSSGISRIAEQTNTSTLSQDVADSTRPPSSNLFYEAIKKTNHLITNSQPPPSTAFRSDITVLPTKENFKMFIHNIKKHISPGGFESVMGVVRDMSEDVKSENNLQGGSANGLQSVHKIRSHLSRLVKCFADELPHQKQALYYVQHIAHFMVAPKHLDMCNTTIRKCISDAYVRHAMALQKSMSVVSAPEVMSMAGIDTSSIPRELIESLSQARYGVSGEENDHSKYVNLVSVGNSSSQPRSAASRLANKPKRSLQLDSIDSSNVDDALASLSQHSSHDENITGTNTSKRAKLMLLHASSSIPPKSVNVLSQVGKMELDMRSSSSSSSTSSALNKSLMCNICLDAPIIACSARCGHICCLSCYEQWLKTSKASCPVCRIEVKSIADVKRITLK